MSATTNDSIESWFPLGTDAMGTSVVELMLILGGVFALLIAHWTLARFLNWRKRRTASPFKRDLIVFFQKFLGLPLVIVVYAGVVLYLSNTLLISWEQTNRSYWILKVTQPSAMVAFIFGMAWLLVALLKFFEEIIFSWGKARGKPWKIGYAKTMARVVRALFPAIVIMSIFQFLPDHLKDATRRTVTILLFVALTYIIIQFINYFEQLLHQKFDLTVPNNLKARAVHTQVRLLKKVIVAILLFIVGGLILMMFPVVRRFGTSILASAGVVGVVIGFAAQKTFSNVFAGIQLAMTQPIRLDDVVIVEGEWGRIEEIRLTYVVIAIWDQRRLIVPVTYFLEKPFQNWTRVTSDILGIVYIYRLYGAH